MSADAAAIFAGRSSGADFPISFDAAFCACAELLDLGEQRAARVVGGEHLVEQPVAHALALDPAAVLRLVAQAADVDHAGRTCVRSSSTQRDASRHAFPAAVRRTCAA